MASTYISSIASMLRNLTLTNNNGRNSSSPKPGITIYAGVVRTINVRTTNAIGATSHSHHQQRPDSRTNESNVGDTTNRVYTRSAEENGQRVHFASPLQTSLPYRSKVNTNDADTMLAREKAKRLALIRQRRLARRMQQQAEGGLRWNRVLRNRLTAGL